MGKNRKKGRNKPSAKQKNKNNQLNDVKTFDFSKPSPISNTAAIEERNEQILANLPKSRYKNDANDSNGLASDNGPGFMFTAEYASDVSDEFEFSFGPEHEKIQELKELREDIAVPTDNMGLASLTAIPGFSCGFNNLEDSKEFVEFTKMIKEQGYKQTQEYDEDGNLRSVSFTQVKKKKKKKRKKKKKSLQKDGDSVEAETAENKVTTEEEPKQDPEPEQPEASDEKEEEVGKVHVNISIGGPSPRPLEPQKPVYVADRSITGAETEIGKAIEVANNELLQKAQISVLNCEDVAKHTAFLAEQRQALKDHMEALQKKIRIHNSLIKVNGRNLLKHFTIVNSLEKAIFATKRDSIRFNIILNQFLSSPAYATMLDSFERVTKKMPKNTDSKTLPSGLFDSFDDDYSSFEELLAREKKSLQFDPTSLKTS